VALIAGLSLPFGFAPLGFYLLPMLSLAVLFRLWLGATTMRGLRYGWFYGLGMFGVGVYWVQISIHQFGLPVLAFSVSMTMLFVAFMALYPALAGWVAVRFPCISTPCRLLLLFPALWTLMEWVRGWLFTGFPWLNLGYSQIDSLLSAYAPIIGVYGVSFAVAMLAGAIALLSLRRWQGSIPILIAGALAWALNFQAWTQPEDEPVKVTLIQGGIDQAVKWEPSQRQTTIDHYLALTRPHWDTRMVIWPETAIPAFYSELQDFFAALHTEAIGHGSAVLIGVPYNPPNDQGRYYNSVIGLGAAAGRYDKRHLVPFGEYIPFGDLLKPVFFFLKIPMSDFSRGNPAQAMINAGGIPLGISVCYEDAFGEEVIDALPAARMLVNVSNDAWFGDSIAPHQHLEMARMRARETGRYLLRATNNGITAIIDAQGHITARAPQFVPYALTGQAVAYAGSTPYVRFGNLPILIVLAGALIMAMPPLVRRSRRGTF
jgi:apolipoprotein N-acyltransferase